MAWHEKYKTVKEQNFWSKKQMKQPSEYSTPNGVAKWSHQLTKRQSSGIVGEETVVAYLSMSLVAQIQKFIPAMNGKHILQHYNNATQNVVLAHKEVMTAINTEMNRLIAESTPQTPEANADTSKPQNLNGIKSELITGVESWLEKKQTTEAIMTAFSNAGFDEVDIQKVIDYKATPAPKAEKTPQVPQAPEPTNAEAIATIVESQTPTATQEFNL